MDTTDTTNQQTVTSPLSKVVATSTAYHLGITAFYAGRSSTPAHDPALMQMVAANPDKRIGASIPLLGSWMRGWDHANLELVTAADSLQIEDYS